MGRIYKNTFGPDRYSNYWIGGNLTNAFAIGAVGTSDDFYLIGAPPDPGTDYPRLTGNVLDSEGNLMFRLERNVLVLNPGNCGRIRSDQIGYEIHDPEGNCVLSVRTTWENVPGVGESYLTTVAGKFFDKGGSIVCETRSEEEGLHLADGKFAMGFGPGGLQANFLFTDREKLIVSASLAAGGRIYEPLEGLIEDKEIDLDGKLLTDGLEIRNCRLRINTGDIVAVPGASWKIHDNSVRLGTNALNIAMILGVPGVG